MTDKEAQDHGENNSKAALVKAAAATIPYHPYANIFPLLQGEQFDAFVQDIVARGLEHSGTRAGNHSEGSRPPRAHTA